MMIYETILAPTEFPNTISEIKRALLTFDEVYIIDPNDRDYFPPQLFMPNIEFPPIFSFNSGPVRPLGKSSVFDNDFDRLMNDVNIAKRQGIIDIISTYDISTSSQFVVGAALDGGYPLNIQSLLLIYQNAAYDQEFLRASIKNDARMLSLDPQEISQMAFYGCKADAGDLPLLDGSFENEGLRDALSNIARSRLAAAIKLICYCASKKIVPFFGLSSYGNLASIISKRANDFIDKVSEHDPYWANRSEVMRLAHEEYIDESILSQMSIDDVLRLRTVAWGQEAAARQNMLQSVVDISKSHSHKSEFTETAQKLISDYRKSSEQLVKERSILKIKICCDILKSFAPILTGETATNLLSRMQTAMSTSTMIYTGCILSAAYAANKIKDYTDIISNLQDTEQECQDNMSYGLHNFYTRMAT